MDKRNKNEPNKRIFAESMLVINKEADNQDQQSKKICGSLLFCKKQTNL